MKWILFVMMFTTPPAPVPKTPPKIPVEKVWALQSTSTLNFDTEDGCNKAGDRITKSIAIASTLNLRGWCFCESLPGQPPCPPEHAELLSDVKPLSDGKSSSFSAKAFAPTDK
jgi:hypothetical protein